MSLRGLPFYLTATGVSTGEQRLVQRKPIGTTAVGERLTFRTTGALKTCREQNHHFNPMRLARLMADLQLQGTGWYRKTFTVPLSDKDKQVIIQFDGVYMNADVWVNGQPMGNHPYGYTSFYYNITQHLKFGEKNTIAVEVKTKATTVAGTPDQEFTGMFG
jgi:hypothetical protein